MRIVVMGPSGAGKSTVGRALADLRGALFIDGDDLHPAANVAKMAAGHPLDDADRMPWLERVGDALHAHDDIVVACSALKRGYRDAIRRREPDAVFVELVVDRDELATRMSTRGEHFMPTTLLDSQLRTLEPLDADERGARVTAGADVARTAESIAERLELSPCGSPSGRA